MCDALEGDPRHLTFDTISRPVRPSGRALVGSEPEPATVFPLQRRGRVRSLRAGKDAEQQASPLKEGDQGETPSLASPLPYHRQPSSLQSKQGEQQTKGTISMGKRRATPMGAKPAAEFKLDWRPSELPGEERSWCISDHETHRTAWAHDRTGLAPWRR